jgi:hypothetical protein
MSRLTTFLDPLRTAALAFFKHELAVRRGEDGVRLVLEARHGATGKAKPPSRTEQARRKEREELVLMLAQLRELLDDLPETRQTMRHLVFLEKSLAKKGLRALHGLPLDVLQRALEQLEGLVTNWSPVGLAGLRSKMAVAIIDREHMDPEAEADAYRTAAVLDNGPDSVPTTGLGNLPQPEVHMRSDDDALAAAYAALGDLAPARIETQAELGSPSARAVAPPAPRHGERAVDIRLRELQT